MTIFHIATRADWDKARAAGAYRPASLRDVGYLHASLPHQLMAVANSVFRGKKGLVLLEIDETKLTVEVKIEDLRRSGSPYPHIYGGIVCKAVVATHEFTPNPDGTFAWPAALGQPPIRTL